MHAGACVCVSLCFFVAFSLPNFELKWVTLCTSPSVSNSLKARYGAPSRVLLFIVVTLLARKRRSLHRLSVALVSGVCVSVGSICRPTARLRAEARRSSPVQCKPWPSLFKALYVACSPPRNREEPVFFRSQDSRTT